MAMRDLMPSRRNRGVARRGEADWFHAFEDHMMDLFENFDRQIDRGTLGGDFFSPSLDISDRGSDLLVTAEIPGMEQKDLDVTVQDNVLTIRGEKKDQCEGGEKGHTYQECRYGRFERSVTLPAEIDPENCKAEYKNGVLRLTMPKRAKAEESKKKIPVNG